ncbi:right-handed parallel beta-helix repeat-containing protein [uncultured Jatrophihabitans sp.]|uniref:right-handed parallel beta-helix repeat-containing protein n=1 Tax=uncultured Jatrophihabitans sp. TaxID=1610747 RepID=UPI0035CBE958
MGKGDCSPSAPCADLGRAIARAGNGGVVEAETGSYPDSMLREPSDAAKRTKDTIVRPAPGAHPVLGRLRSYVPHVRFENMSGRGGIYLTASANYTTFDHLTLSGKDATMLVRASHVLIESSLIEGGVQRDGVQIAANPRNTDITIRKTTIRHFTSITNANQHPDCIQLFDTTHVTIEQNSLYDCFNSAITFSPGAHKGIDHVTVEGNFLQGCMLTYQACKPGGSSMDLRVQVQATTISHNTFGSGSVRLPVNPGVTATANIIEYLSVAPCQTAVTHSLLINFTRYSCHEEVPNAAGGNWTGDVSFKNPGDNDLTPVGSVPANPSSGSAGIPAGLGIRDKLPAGTVGAAP